MATEQKAPFVRIKVLHGTDADRRLANDIDDSEIHVTTDQFRIWLGQGNLLSGNVHHVAADQAARLNLKNTAQRGCWNGDTCKQTDTGKIYQCISNEGTGTGDWLELTDHNHTLSNIVDAGTAAGYDVPATGNAASGQVVLGNDSRLTDPRDPNAHTHPLSEISDAGTAASKNVPASGDAAAGEAVLGNDSRLTDSRPPTAHTHPLSEITDSGTAASKNVPATGDAAAGEAVLGNDSRLTDSRPPTAHTHTLSGITDAGSAASRDVPSSGDATSTQCVLGNDSRLGAATGVLPIGGIFAYDTGISGASYSTSIFARCEGGSYPDLRDKFIMGATTSGGTGGSNTHTHTVNITTQKASPCSGSGVDAAVSVSTDPANHLPPYRKEIMLCRYA